MEIIIQIYPGASWKSDIYLDCDGKGHTAGASSDVVNIFYAFWSASRHVMGWRARGDVRNCVPKMTGLLDAI